MERSWILVGMMGVGKSSIGRAMADETGREFIDMDALLQKRFGRPISQIFEVYGQETFRDHETALLKTFVPGKFVVSTGGGVVLRDENHAEMRRLGITIYLQASLETLVGRLALSRKRRPLLQADDWEDKLKTILDDRKTFYERADLCVSVDGLAIEGAVDKIKSALAQGGLS